MSLTRQQRLILYFTALLLLSGMIVKIWFSPKTTAETVEQQSR